MPVNSVVYSGNWFLSDSLITAVDQTKVTLLVTVTTWSPITNGIDLEDVTDDASPPITLGVAGSGSPDLSSITGGRRVF